MLRSVGWQLVADILGQQIVYTVAEARNRFLFSVEDLHVIS
jgi:hypothetical protein